MQPFHEFVTQGPAPLTHLPHLEDLVLTRGGWVPAIDVLTDLGNLLEGEATSKLTLSVKWDGSPSVVFGPDTDGRFFVSTKAGLSATPKRAHSHAEIDQLFSASVAPILHVCLDELPALEPTAIMQGDYLYSTVTDLMHLSVGGRLVSLSFQPNTIKYIVPYESTVGKRLLSSAMGIVLHTVYVNGTPTPMTDADFRQLKATPRVFVVDPTYRFQPDNVAFSADEAFDFHVALEAVMQASMDLNSAVYDQLEAGPLKALLPRFINACVRTETTPSVSEFIAWLDVAAEADANTRKTGDGRVAVLQRYAQLRDAVAGNVRAWRGLFKLHAAVQDAKNLLIRKLGAVPSDFDATIADQRTGPEGFVATGAYGSVKLVERAVFSRANFGRSPLHR